MVTIFDSSDLAFAIQCCRILKLRIYFKKEEKKVSQLPVSLVRSELRDIRDRVNKMLAMLEDGDSGILSGASYKSSKEAIQNERTDGERSKSSRASPREGIEAYKIIKGGYGMNSDTSNSGHIPSSVPQSNNTAGKEFDPLQQQHQQQQPSSVVPQAPQVIRITFNLSSQ